MRPSLNRRALHVSCTHDCQWVPQRQWFSYLFIYLFIRLFSKVLLPDYFLEVHTPGVSTALPNRHFHNFWLGESWHCAPSTDALAAVLLCSELTEWPCTSLLVSVHEKHTPSRSCLFLLCQVLQLKYSCTLDTIAAIQTMSIQVFALTCAIYGFWNIKLYLSSIRMQWENLSSLDSVQHDDPLLTTFRGRSVDRDSVKQQTSSNHTTIIYYFHKSYGCLTDVQMNLLQPQRLASYTEIYYY